jgi:hypothetical protein
MITHAPPKRAPGAGEQTGRKLTTTASYHAVAFLAIMFGAPFWFFEQRRGRLQDRIDNEKDDK